MPLFRNPSAIGIFLNLLTTPAPTTTTAAPTTTTAAPTTTTAAPTTTTAAPTTTTAAPTTTTAAPATTTTAAPTTTTATPTTTTATPTTTTATPTTTTVIPTTTTAAPTTGTVYLSYCFNGSPVQESFFVDSENVVVQNINQACAAYTSLLQGLNPPATSISCSIVSQPAAPGSCPQPTTTTTTSAGTPAPTTTTTTTAAPCQTFFCASVGEYLCVGEFCPGGGATTTTTTSAGTPAPTTTTTTTAEPNAGATCTSLDVSVGCCASTGCDAGLCGSGSACNNPPFNRCYQGGVNC